MLSGQPYLGGELICIVMQSHTVGLPLALGFTVKGLSVGLVNEHPASNSNTHPTTANRLSEPTLLVTNVIFLSKSSITKSYANHSD